MATTANDIIGDAIKQVFGHRTTQKISKAQLLSELSRQDADLVHKIAQINPDMLATATGSSNVTAARNTNGYTLSDGIHYRDFTHADTDEDEYVPIRIVQRQHRQSPGGHPAGMLRTASAAGVFYPIDPRGERWQGSETRDWFEPSESHEVRYSYIPAPADLTSLSDTINSPDMARNVLTYAVELAAIQSIPGADQARVETAVQKFLSARDQLLELAEDFHHPSGLPGGASPSRPLTDAEWVHANIDGVS